MDECWTKVAGKIEEEVLNKYMVEDCKNGAYRGRGEISNTQMVQRLLGKEIILFQRVLLAAQTKYAEKLN